MSVSFFKRLGPIAKVPHGVPEDFTAPGAGLSALLAEAEPIVLTGERLLAAQAMQLLMRVDSELREARAQWNHDWFRRLMRIRPRAVRRLLRRWQKLVPPPSTRLGTLRRRYHANLARYFYKPQI